MFVSLVGKTRKGWWGCYSHQSFWHNANLDGILGFGIFIYTQFTHKVRLASVDNKFLPKWKSTKVLLKKLIDHVITWGFFNEASQLSLGICGARFVYFECSHYIWTNYVVFQNIKNHVKVYALWILLKRVENKGLNHF